MNNAQQLDANSIQLLAIAAAHLDENGIGWGREIKNDYKATGRKLNASVGFRGLHNRGLIAASFGKFDTFMKITDAGRALLASR